MPTLRHDDVLLRLIKDVNDIRANLRRVVANLPLYDIANENTPPQITANQNNYVPGNYDVLMLSSSQNVQITGIANGVKGRKLQLYNVGSYPILLPYESSNSLAKNRLRFQTGLPAVLEPGTNLTIYYYSTVQRWVTGTEIFDIAGKWATGTISAGDWSSVAWSPTLEIFVAVGLSGGTNKMAKSTDGISWSPITPPVAKSWNEIAWIDHLGMFIAGADVSTGSTNDMIYSTDGINWNAITTPAPAYAVTTYTGYNLFKKGWNGFAWSDDLGLLVAVGYYADNLSIARPLLATSPDGVNWTDRVGGLPANSGYGMGVARSDDLGYFAESQNSKVAVYSANGLAWTEASASFASSSIAYSEKENIFVILPESSSRNFYTSINGTNWSLHTNGLASAVSIADVIFCEDLNIFMAVGTDCSIFSTDGILWQVGALVPSGGWAGVAWSGKLNKFVAVGFNSLVMTTP